MLRFSFTVNRSFLSWPTHPITVPKGQIDYEVLEAEGLDRGIVNVVCPDNTSVSGEMYSGTAGYGPYYQIRMNIPKVHPILDLPIGYSLLVEMERANKIRWVRLKAS